MSLTNVAKYRPHRPHHCYCGRLQDFHAVGILHNYHARRWLYRPQFIDIDRVSTVKDLLRLQDFHLLNDSRGRCGRYVNDLYGYIGVVQVNEGCYQAISRR
jgi:hypothetical protein